MLDVAKLLHVFHQLPAPLVCASTWRLLGVWGCLFISVGVGNTSGRLPSLAWLSASVCASVGFHALQRLRCCVGGVGRMSAEGSGLSCESEGPVGCTNGELLSHQVPGHSHWSRACPGHPGPQADTQ